LRRRRVHARADAALLRARLEVAGLFTVGLRLSRLADQLANRRHVEPLTSRSLRPASRPDRNTSPIAARRCTTRETNSTPKPCSGLGAAESRGSRAKPRSC